MILGLVYADYGGGYAGSGFRYGSNAREFSLAGALIADKTPGFYAFSNPALLQFSKSNHIGLSINSMSLDRSVQRFSFSRRLPPSAGVGVAILRAGTDNIQGRNFENQITETFSVYDLEGIISFGVALGSKLAFGLNIKIIYPNLAPEIMDKYSGNQDGTALSGDLGVIYKFHRRLIFGGLIQNLGGSYNWKLTNPWEDKERNYLEELPQIISIGAAYSKIKGVILFFQEDIVSTPGNDVNYRTRIAGEFHLRNGIKLRAGLKQARGTAPTGVQADGLNIKPSFGVGVPIKVWQRQLINLDYALDLGSVGEGLSHLFSFSLQF